MAKGYCTKCDFKNEQDAIFNFDEKIGITECPICHCKLSTQEAIKNYDRLLKNAIIKARLSRLYIKNYQKAYREFGHVLEIDPTNFTGYAGRILCLLSLSTLRTSHFSDAKELLKMTFSTFKEKEVVWTRFIGLLKYVAQINDTYIKRVFKRLSYNTYFYDEACFRLYILRLYEAMDFENTILDELKYFKEKNTNFHTIDESIFKIQDQLKEQETYFKSFHPFINGYSYKAKIENKDINKLEVISDELKVTVNFSTFHPMTLSDDEKGKIKIKDNVFPKKTIAYDATILLLILSVLGLVCGLVLIIFGFLFSDYLIILSSIGGTLAGASLIMLIVRFFVKTLATRKIRCN